MDALASDVKYFLIDLNADDFRPVCTQATPVVPLPMKGSRKYSTFAICL